jgi:tetratricopeptide (TPR) repeat protein
MHKSLKAGVFLLGILLAVSFSSAGFVIPVYPHEPLWDDYLNLTILVPGDTAPYLADEDAFAENHTENVSAWIIRGAVGLDQYDWKTAVASFKKAISIDPKQKSAYNGLFFASLISQDKNLIEDSIYRMRTAFPHDALTPLYHAYGNIWMDRYDEAEKLLNNQIRVNEDSVGARHLLGQTFIYTGKNEDAMKAINHTLAIDPAYPAAWLQKALITIVVDNATPDALKALDKAIELDPGYFVAYSEKARILSRNGSYNESMEVFNEALSLFPDNPEILMDKANTLLNAEKYEDSLNVSEQILNKTHNRYWGAWNNKAANLMSLGRYDEAASAYEKSEELHQNFVIPKNIGYIRTVQGKHAEAIEAYDRSLKLYPEYAEAWQFKGTSLAALGRYEEALQAFDRATTLEPERTDAWRNKAEVLTRLGRYHEARFAYTKAAEGSKS